GGVRLRVEGSEAVTVQDGYLHLTTEVGKFTLPLLAVEGSAVPAGRPVATRAANETFEVVAPFATVTPDGDVSSQTAYPEEAYFGSYLGGNDWDWPYAIAVSGQGDILNRDGNFASGESRSIWVAGWTTSSNFPDEPGGTALSGTSDAFVTKMKRGALYVDPDFSAYIGGSNEDAARGIAADASGNVYVTGFTKSSDFATTGNPYDATFNGCVDAFVLKLASDGNLLYASYLGGSHVTIPGLGDQCGDDDGTAIAVDSQGSVYLTGSTRSQDFPTTPGAYDTVFSYFDVGLNKDTFVAKLDLSTGASGLLYSTFVGGGTPSQGHDIAIDKSGNVYVTGNADGGPDGRNFFPTTHGAYNEVFITGDVGFFLKLNPGGNGAVDLLYSTFLGGADGSGGYGNTSLALDAAGHAYVCGTTSAPNFPTTSGAFDTTCGIDGNCNGGFTDVFISKLNPGGNGSADLLYSTFLGGKYQDEGADIAIGANGDVYVTGKGVSEGFPITPDAYSSNVNQFFDVFVTRLRFQGAGADDVVYSTAVGSTGNDKGTAMVLDEDDRVYVVGETISSNFPTTSHALYKNYIGGNQDIILFRLLTPPSPDLSTSTKKVEPTAAIAGDVVTYTVKLVNSGVISATVSFTDTLPSTLLLQGSPTANAGSPPTVTGQTLTWAGTVTEATTVLITYAAELTSTTTLTPTIRNIAQIDDGVGNIYMRSAFVNWKHIYLPLVLRNYAP
ncbi:MAG: SBBP repeat-containing protein, partial [Anaerolineae bacterium]|nr:SBBP repeat-containing protein [Anaerolineae bacterium]